MTNEASIKALNEMGATWAVRAPAEGPNNRLRRGKWTIDGRPAKPHEARKLNALNVSRFHGPVVIEAKPGAWQGSRAKLDALGVA